MKLRENNYQGRFLKKHHIEYMKLYAGELTQAQLAKGMGFTQATVCYWLKQLNLVAKKAIFQKPNVVIPACTPEAINSEIQANKLQQRKTCMREVQRVPHFQPDSKKKIVRPPAKYDNMSREDHINKYLNMDI